jgi:NRAMP (natural resistance-associated macrophage protein)-like metal ion transporter
VFVSSLRALDRTFGIEHKMFLVSPSPLSIMLGFVPTVSSSSVYTAISLVGAVVMPHNIYLHSALVMSRNIDRTRVSINEGNKYNLIESSIALLLSFLINVAILTVSATEFSDATNKEDIGLDNASSLLKNLLKNGVVASIIFGIALLASGQSSTITGTFAGQFVMEVKFLTSLTYSSLLSGISSVKNSRLAPESCDAISGSVTQPSSSSHCRS